MTQLTRRGVISFVGATSLVPNLARANPAAALEGTLAELLLQDGKTLRVTLADAMTGLNTPALSVAAISRYQLDWAQAYGVTGPGESAKATTDTLFQAASISKPVAATGALYQVQRGRLDLDGNVNDRLKSWKVPDNAFTATEKVTLRRLISHTAGLSVHGFPGYATDVPRPTVQQILDGVAPANTDPVRVVFTPGSRQQYSGGGVTVEQLLMTDVTGRDFPALMQETVLGPLGMKSSTYEQPLSNARTALAAAGTRMDGKPVGGRWHIYPEMAAAGLWTTPSDLAHFAIATAKARLGQANPVLSKATMAEMFRPVPNGDILGFFSHSKNPGSFEHSGSNAGFRSLLIMNGDTGDGVAVMTNSDGGALVQDLIMRRVGQLYNWKHDFGGPARAIPLVAILHGADLALSHFEAVRASAFEYDLNMGGYALMSAGRIAEAIRLFRRNAEAYPQSANVYDSLAEAYEAAGDKANAIANYRLSLERDPNNGHASERLKALGQG
ncbi:MULTISPECIES: serine hydrolase domain-containing protein [Asticcacaulis]|uniref:serine hydrolase domain-containing protein n=1 Tax=Asticcacaulis TaxID=76890 RepID=UPI001AE92891|nr:MULTISPECIES: serine hydrolase domain-containing protein [Asticcacaulis]MBP2160252.1 CubicO group peptidase (beta-lactamase class C family) [Asticcacaulis solisilvae]MDR6801445.1 CubicO group peptidase (beta-lactamase class C family) [Asticcacaulis sp. BE141]